MTGSVVELKVIKKETQADLLAAYLNGDVPPNKQSKELDHVYMVAGTIHSIYGRLMVGADTRRNKSQIGKIDIPKGGTIWKLYLGTNMLHQRYYPRVDIEYLGRVEDVDGFNEMLYHTTPYELARFNPMHGAIGWHLLEKIYRTFCVASETNCGGYTRQECLDFVRLRHVALINGSDVIVVSLYLPKLMVSLIHP
jgi:hypothetical protein